MRVLDHHAAFLFGESFSPSVSLQSTFLANHFTSSSLQHPVTCGKLRSRFTVGLHIPLPKQGYSSSVAPAHAAPSSEQSTERIQLKESMVSEARVMSCPLVPIWLTEPWDSNQALLMIHTAYQAFNAVATISAISQLLFADFFVAMLDLFGCSVSHTMARPDYLKRPYLAVFFTCSQALLRACWSWMKDYEPLVSLFPYTMPVASKMLYFVQPLVMGGTAVCAILMWPLVINLLRRAPDAERAAPRGRAQPRQKKASAPRRSH